MSATIISLATSRAATKMNPRKLDKYQEAADQLSELARRATLGEFIHIAVIVAKPDGSIHETKVLGW